MREINNISYYDVKDIVEMFTSNETEESIIYYFESGELKGKKIEKKWFTTKTDIEEFISEKEGINYFFTDPQEIDLNDLVLKGRILDIGGGGEGIIGQLKGENVISIDLRRSELEEAIKAGDIKSLKILMDAKDLKFLDNTFDTVTAFFSIMYTPKSDHYQIFKESYRVLRKEGEFILWDPVIPKKFDKKKQLYAILLKISIKNKKIITGYGTRWDKEQDIKYFVELLKEISFKFVKKEIEKEFFCLGLQKI
ncbi:MAG: class I SAM-dependent methyltransferase [Candidatus Odinarchaeota archaeon]